MDKEKFLNKANIEDKSLLLDIYNKAILAEKNRETDIFILFLH